MLSLMSSEWQLPSFERPPLDEVAADMQFAPLPIKAADIGDFQATLGDDYPQSIDMLPLPPSFETTGPAPLQPFLLNPGGGLLPRSWFISNDDEHVVQLQADRLIVNWRQRPNGGAYPRYPKVRRRFEMAHEALHRFVHRHGYSDIFPNQCNLTYFNKVPLPAGHGWGDIHVLLKDVRLSATDCHLMFRRSLKPAEDSAVAHLQVECRPHQVGIDQRAWALNISVRGRPATADIDSVLNFFDMAHIEIVRCFSEITTDAMHQTWGRL